MTKVLFFTYAFPPINAPRSIQIARLLKYSSLKPDIIYGQGHYDDDNSLYPDHKNYVGKISRVPFTKRQEFIEKIRRRQSLSFFKHADLFQGWSIKAANMALKDFDYDVIVSFGSPMSVHLGALKIANKTGCKWIACFSDPWTKNPFEKRKPRHQNLIQKYEASVFNRADILLFNTQETIDLVMLDFRNSIKSKASILPHSYDPSLYDTKKDKNNDILTLRYVGHFYGDRTPAPLLEALKKIPANLLNGLRIECFGHVQSQILTRYSDIINKHVFFNTPVSYKQSLDLMSDADGLLVIDAPADQSVFLPSKLVDYIGAEKPILGITPEGASASILRSMNYPVCNPLDNDAIKNMILEFVDGQHRTPAKNDSFSPHHVANILIDKIKSV